MLNGLKIDAGKFSHFLHSNARKRSLLQKPPFLVIKLLEFTFKQFGTQLELTTNYCHYNYYCNINPGVTAGRSLTSFVFTRNIIITITIIIATIMTLYHRPPPPWCRAEFDVYQNKCENVRPDVQVFVSCNFCGKSIGYSTAASRNRLMYGGMAHKSKVA